MWESREAHTSRWMTDRHGITLAVKMALNSNTNEIDRIRDDQS